MPSSLHFRIFQIRLENKVPDEDLRATHYISLEVGHLSLKKRGPD